MTLLLAGIEGTSLWMASDTAISGGSLDLREREEALKITPSDDGQALIGFAGDKHHGLRCLEAVAKIPASEAGAEWLLAEHKQVPSVDFAYGFRDASGGLRLARVSEGRIEWLTTLYIGQTEAFEHFQKIKHDAELDVVPDALKMFVCAIRGDHDTPQALSNAIHLLIRLFAERQERDVGGWVLPYVLTPDDGALLCNYGFSVSDPLFKQLVPGSLAPPSTAEAGGYSLSVTELGKGDGIVVYWVQRPGGKLYWRREGVMEVHQMDGRAAPFKEQGAAICGKLIDLFFSDEPISFPEEITILRDQTGQPSIAIARSGNTFSTSVLNVATPFHTSGRLEFGVSGRLKARSLSTEQFALELGDDRKTAALTLLNLPEQSPRIELDASALDRAIACMAHARSLMPDVVAAQPSTAPGTEEHVIVNPGWTAERGVHPALGGVTLRMRHPGVG